MASAAITKRTVDAAKPAATDQFLWDTDVSGFGLKVTPSGSKIYVFQYRIARPGEAERTPAKRYTVGKHGRLTPEQARARAKELAVLVERGIDPRQAEQDAIAAQVAASRLAEEQARLEGELAFEKIAAVWLDDYEVEKQRRPSSVRLAKTIVNHHLTPKLKGRPMPHIGRADLQPILDGIPAKNRGIRRAVFTYASVLFGWAARRGDIPSNPLKEMAKPEAPKARERVLTDAELAAVWKASALSVEPFGPFFRLLILTGQRRAEVAGIKWSEVDRAAATWTIPADRAKNGVAHIVPLNAMVVGELDQLALAVQVKANATELDAKRWPKAGFVLTTTGKSAVSGVTKVKNALDAAIAKAHGGEHLPAWRIHDLRRTLATGFQRLGIRFEVTEAVLNHISGAKGGIAGIYQRHDWKEEKRSALDAWARHVTAIVAPADDGNVVALSDARKLQAKSGGVA